MDQTDLRTALLQNDRLPDVESELALLHELVRSERRRANRLKFWTIAVWATFFALLAILAVSLPFSVARAPETQTAVQATPAGGHDLGLSLFLVSILLLALVSLPSAGVVLLILMVLAHRSATVAQFRSSIAAIEAQLKSLAAARETEPSTKQG